LNADKTDFFALIKLVLGFDNVSSFFFVFKCYLGTDYFVSSLRSCSETLIILDKLHYFDKKNRTDYESSSGFPNK